MKLALAVLAFSLLAQPLRAEISPVDRSTLRACVYRTDTAAALPLVEKAVKEQPEDPEVHDIYAHLLLDQGNTDDAIREVTRAEALAPKGALYRVHLGDLYFQTFVRGFRKWCKAHESDVLGMINRDVPTAWESNHTTYLFTEERPNDHLLSQMNPKEWERLETHVKGAITAYNQALAIDPQNRLANQGKGAASIVLGEWKDACDAFTKGGVPRFDPFLYELGRTTYVDAGLTRRGRPIVEPSRDMTLESGKGDEAIRLWELVVREQPANGWGYWYLRNAYEQFHHGDWRFDFYDAMRTLFPEQVKDATDAHVPSLKDGLKELERIAEKHPDDASVWRGIGIAHVRLKDQKAALASFRKAFALDPQDGYSLFQIGAGELESKQYDRAADTLGAAVKLRDGDALVWEALGTVLEKKGDPEAAATAYERATDLAPDNADFHFNAAALLLDQRRGAEALPHLEIYLALRPYDKKAKDLRDVVTQVKDILAKQGQ